MACYTLFAYGTGERHETTNNIISQFAHACTSAHSHLDGPDLLGRRVQPNAEEGAERILNWLQEKGQEQGHNSINLTGFSRGSVTCIRIANILQNKKSELENKASRSVEEQKLLDRLSNLDVNMFLMDPVAGLSDKNVKESKVIPELVTNYVSLLQMDERRRDFKPQDMTRTIIANPQKTKVSMLPMFGNHSDSTKIKSEAMESGPQLAWYSLHQFLTQNGTQFAEGRIPRIAYTGASPATALYPTNAIDLLYLFSKHHQNRPAYLASGLAGRLSDGIPAPRTKRSLNNHLEYYVKDSKFFVNQLERELFKIAYPRSFNYLFEKNQYDPRFPGASASKKEDVLKELDQMRGANSLLLGSLVVRGVNLRDGKITLGDPRGYHYLEPCISVQQLFPNLVPDAVKKHAAQMNPLAILEREAYRVTFQYEREKSELNFSDDRGQANRTRQIRQEINDLVNRDVFNRLEEEPMQPKEPEELKYIGILDILERHYKELVLNNSSSELTQMLGEVLAKHDRLYVVQQSVTNKVLVKAIHTMLSLAKEGVLFAGSLGYIGGPILYGFGAALEAIGERANELIGDTGDNAIKTIGARGAMLLKGLGFMIKHSFGIRPLTQLLVNGIKEMRDWLTQAINTSTITDEHLIEPLIEAFVEPDLALDQLVDGAQASVTGYRECVQQIRDEGEEQISGVTPGLV